MDISIKYRIIILQSTDPKTLSNKKGSREDDWTSLRRGNQIDVRGGWMEGTGGEEGTRESGFRSDCAPTLRRDCWYQPILQLPWRQWLSIYQCPRLDQVHSLRQWHQIFLFFHKFTSCLFSEDSLRFKAPLYSQVSPYITFFSPYFSRLDAEFSEFRAKVQRQINIPSNHL